VLRALLVLPTAATNFYRVSERGPGLDEQYIESQTVLLKHFACCFAGTSMATPHVSGVAALLMSQFPGKTGTEIREAIQESAIDMGACGYDNMFGHGMIDAVAAANFLAGGNAASDQTNCITTTVSILTDDWGSETTWAISKKEAAGASADFIVYKGGPYADEQRATYIDTIELPEGCYEFKVEDSYGDG
jgi:hypothetical protein